MKKLALTIAFAVLTLTSTVVLANNSVTVTPNLSGSAGPVTGSWNSAGNTAPGDTFTISDPDNLMMIVSISSSATDFLLHPYSNFTVTCNSAQTTVLAGSSFVCRTNTDVTILSQANATDKAAAGNYSLIFEKSGCTTNCNNA